MKLIFLLCLALVTVLLITSINIAVAAGYSEHQFTDRHAFSSLRTLPLPLPLPITCSLDIKRQWLTATVHDNRTEQFLFGLYQSNNNEEPFNPIRKPEPLLLMLFALFILALALINKRANAKFRSFLSNRR